MVPLDVAAARDVESASSVHQLRLLAFGAQWHQARAGEYLFHMGDDPSDGAYLILEGEAGLGFAVNLKKSDFTGKAALERNARAQRKVLRGLRFAGNDVPPHGAQVFSGERPIGVITSAAASPYLRSAR